MDGTQLTYDLADRQYNNGGLFGGGSEGIWLFAILALFGLGGNGLFGGGRGNEANNINEHTTIIRFY